MQTKPSLTILATLLFLLGVFGYIFPTWHNTHFTNNENLFHVLIAVVLWMVAGADAKKRMLGLLLSALVFLAFGIFGFTLKQPLILIHHRQFMQLDEVDNYFHIVFGLAFAWVWLRNRRAV
jgi:hypothetical protein